MKLRDELYEELKKDYLETKYIVRPRSYAKYNAKYESTIIICYPNDTHQIVGIQVQTKNGPYKIWFNEHPEWELETDYPVKMFAENGTGAGSGAGFYISSKEDCIDEIKAFLARYYD